MSDLGYDAPTPPPPPVAMTLDDARNVRTEENIELGMLSFTQLKEYIKQPERAEVRAVAAQFILDNWK